MNEAAPFGAVFLLIFYKPGKSIWNNNFKLNF